MDVARIFFSGGGTLMQKIVENFFKNYQKIPKNFQKYSKKFQKHYTSFVKKIAKTGFLSIFFK